MRSRQPPDVADRDTRPERVQSRRDDVPAWERLETGRFQPRRFKGSFPGRELG